MTNKSFATSESYVDGRQVPIESLVQWRPIAERVFLEQTDITNSAGGNGFPMESPSKEAMSPGRIASQPALSRQHRSTVINAKVTLIEPMTRATPDSMRFSSK